MNADAEPWEVVPEEAALALRVQEGTARFENDHREVRGPGAGAVIVVVVRGGVRSLVSIVGATVVVFLPFRMHMARCVWNEEGIRPHRGPDGDAGGEEDRVEKDPGRSHHLE